MIKKVIPHTLSFPKRNRTKDGEITGIEYLNPPIEKIKNKHNS